MTDPAGLGDRLRELSAEVATLATGRDAGLWLYALESLARQADDMERQRAEWRASITRVRAEVAAWGPPAPPADTSPAVGTEAWNATTWTVGWCAGRVHRALDGGETDGRAGV